MSRQRLHFTRSYRRSAQRSKSLAHCSTFYTLLPEHAWDNSWCPLLQTSEASQAFIWCHLTSLASFPACANPQQVARHIDTHKKTHTSTVATRAQSESLFWLEVLLSCSVQVCADLKWELPATTSRMVFEPNDVRVTPSDFHLSKKNAK